MELAFEPMSEVHRKEVIDIYNHYIRTSFAAYPEQPVPYEFYDRFLEMTEGYPAYVLLIGSQVAGFCFLRPYKPLSTFSSCAEITYFLHPGFRGKGVGKAALVKLEADARERDIAILLASIASENDESIHFHKKNGFRQCGNFEGIIRKFEKRFDMIWMQKSLS